MHMMKALTRAAVAVLTFGIVAGPFAVAGHSAAPSCASIERRQEWSTISAPAFPEGPAEITAYAVDPLYPLGLVATNGTVVMGSNDGGCTWDPIFQLELLPNLDKMVSSANTTIKQIVIPDAPEPPNKRSIYMVLEEAVGPAVRPHIAFTHNSGRDWEISNEGLPLVSGGVWSLASAPSNRDILYLLVRENPANPSDVTYASHNGGATWEERGATGPGGIATDLTVDPLDPAIVWSWGPGGLFRSDNGGASRSKFDIVATGVSLADVQHVPGSPARIMAYETETQTFSVSRDGGATWVRIGGPNIFSHSMTHGPAGEVIVSGHDGVYQLADQQFWLPINRKDQPDLYDIQASHAGEPLLFGLSTKNQIERYDALNAAVHVDPFEPTDDELIGGATQLLPNDKTVKLQPGSSRTVRYRLGLPPHPTPLDVFFLLDTSESMAPSINGLRVGMQQIINDLEAARIDVHFGLGEYKDYPIPGYGDPQAGDFPYRLDRVIGPADAGLADALEKLESSGGGRADLPESQLTGLYQAATGAGDPGFVPTGSDAGFRPGALKVMVHITDAAFHDDAAHPSPPFAQVAAALRDRGILQIGLAVYGPHGPDGLSHLTDMALATETRAPSPVDCDGDGNHDVVAGQPLACVVSTEQSAGVLELAPAIISSLRAVTQEVSVQLTTNNDRLTAGIKPTVYPSFNVLDAGNLEFELTYFCPLSLAGEEDSVRLAATVAGRAVAHADATVICKALPKEEEPDEVSPALIAAPGVIPRFLIPAPPPPPPPITESAPGTQQMFQAQPAAAAQEQEELQTAVAWQESIKKELAEEYSFTSLRRQEPEPWLLYASAALMGLAYGGATVLRRRSSLSPVRAWRN